MSVKGGPLYTERWGVAAFNWLLLSRKAFLQKPRPHMQKNGYVDAWDWLPLPRKRFLGKLRPTCRKTLNKGCVEGCDWLTLPTNCSSENLGPTCVLVVCYRCSICVYKYHSSLTFSSLYFFPYNFLHSILTQFFLISLKF